MDQQFIESQIVYMNEVLPLYIEKMVQDVLEVIKSTEKSANEDFEQHGITFTRHSVANADYLMAVLHEKLFDLLHKGNLQMAQTILTMAAKRTGVTLHVDS